MCHWQATSALSAEEIEDRARRAQALRKSGNSEFEAGNHAAALTLYWQSLSLLPLPVRLSGRCCATVSGT